MHAEALAELIDRQRPGWSLEQPFYTSPEIFEIERRGWLAAQWYVLGHGSELPESGSYIVRELLGESLIIIRDGEGGLRAFYNVCRHRGSRICDRDGRAARLVCPYHAWSYRLDGSLSAAPALPNGIDTGQLGLKPVPVREVGGIILGTLEGDPGQLSDIERQLAPGLQFHGIPQARIAVRRNYPTRGNWKLVIENFVECYHCFPAHPEYCSVMDHVHAIARESPEAAAAWQQTAAAWLANEAHPGCPIESRDGTSREVCGATRAPIGGGRKTQSEDGQPVAPLMGSLTRFDGGVSAFRCEPFVFLAALNDYAIFFQFLPTGPESTDITATWLVAADASESQVDIERMLWLWDVTTVEDKALIERNAAGVRSRAYAPGPYSKLESMPARLVRRYLEELSERVCR